MSHHARKAWSNGGTPRCPDGQVAEIHVKTVVMGFQWESSDKNGDLMGFALGNTYICIYIYYNVIIYICGRPLVSVQNDLLSCWIFRIYVKFTGGFSSQKNGGRNRQFDQGLGMHPRNYGLVLNLADLCGTSRTLHTFALCSEKLRGSKITGPHTVQAIFF